MFDAKTYHLNSTPRAPEGGHRFECEFDISRMLLGIANYSVAIALHQADSNGASNHDWSENALVLGVLPDDEANRVGVANPSAGITLIVAGEGAIR